MSRYARPVLAALALLAIVIALPTAAAQEEVKIRVINTVDPSTWSEKYLLNTSDMTLVGADVSKAQFLSGSLADLDAGDDLIPVILLSFDRPTVDLDTNETVVYAYVIRRAYGPVIVGVADVNGSSLANLTFVKVEAFGDDIAVVVTSSDIVIQFRGGKLSIALSGYSNPRLVLSTDGEAYFASLSYVELRSLRNPPPGYTLIREGSGETTFTIGVSGRVWIWFDESHDPDMDLFIFDRSNPHFAQAHHSRPWGWLSSHCTRFVFADGAPYPVDVRATGQLKLVVKKYPPSEGDPANARWRIAIRREGSYQPQPQPPSSPPRSPPSDSGEPSQPGQPPATVTRTVVRENPVTVVVSYVQRIERVVGSGSTLMLVALALLGIAVVALLLRRR